ncbi:MAG: ComEA family DNA-binding protein, partial [Bdellovibrionota bacterium]
AKFKKVEPLVTANVTAPSAAAPIASSAPKMPAAPEVNVPTRPGANAKAALPSGALININTASKEELERLPEIGPKKAEAIIQARPFHSAEEIMKVKGIKQGIFAKIKSNITVQ